MNYLNPGDFADLYGKLRQRGGRFLWEKTHWKASDRIRHTWETIQHTPGWWQVPAVRERWNTLISGNPHQTYQQYIAHHYLADRSSLRLLSIGCGTGSQEIRFAQTGKFVQISGFDLSEHLIQEAQLNAQRQGADHLHFFVDDVYHFHPQQPYDVILFHQSLHHFSQLDHLLPKVKQWLRPGGLLVLHEYVGPDRLQFPPTQINAINQVLVQLPPALRIRWTTGRLKQRVYAPGRWRMQLTDPSEAIQSSHIPVAVNTHFRPLQETPLGGDLLHLLLKDIAHHFTSNSAKNSPWLRFLFEQEDEYLRAQNNRYTNFAFGIYQSS